MRIDFTAHRHPVLAIPCPACQARAGVMCKRPSGHRASDLHQDRKLRADLLFIEQEGEDASIERDGDHWWIDPSGRAKRLARERDQKEGTITPA